MGEQLITLVCQDCGKSREVFPSQIGTRYAIKDGIYRCQPCFQEARRVGLVPKARVHIVRTLTCSICGVSRNVSKSDASDATPEYKCRPCYILHKKTTPQPNKRLPVACPDCGVIRMMKPSKSRKTTGHCKSCARKGPRSGQWNGGPVTLICDGCGHSRQTSPSQASRCVKPYRCAKCCKHSGPANPAWNGGTSFAPYPILWSKQLRDQIRDRDAHQCALCGTNQNQMRLDVHHIDYDKTNLAETNLISLCRSCHPKTNFNRPHWQAILSEMIDCRTKT